MTTKSREVIDTFSTAIKMTMKTHNRIKKLIDRGEFSTKKIQDEIDFTKDRYSLEYAFEPIVSYNEHIPDLHYKHKNEDVPKESLILVDIGYKYNNYCSDITRCYNINNPAKVNLYRFAKNIQRYVQLIVRPGISFDELEYLYIEEYIKNLVDIELLKNSNFTIETKTMIKELFQPHTIGHSVDTVVHEKMDSSKPLEVNMVITIEPGIYFEKDIEDKLEELNVEYDTDNMISYKSYGGARYEDMFLITEEGCKKL